MTTLLYSSISNFFLANQDRVRDYKSRVDLNTVKTFEDLLDTHIQLDNGRRIYVAGPLIRILIGCGVELNGFPRSDENPVLKIIKRHHRQFPHDYRDDFPFVTSADEFTRCKWSIQSGQDKFETIPDTPLIITSMLYQLGILHN